MCTARLYTVRHLVRRMQLKPYLTLHQYSYNRKICLRICVITCGYNNLSAGIQNVTGAYIIMLLYRHLLTTRLHGKAAV